MPSELILTLMSSVVFQQDHLRFTSGIICGSGSFAAQFGDHLRSGIICGAVQLFPLFQVIFEFVNINVSCINLLILISKEVVG